MMKYWENTNVRVIEQLAKGKMEANVTGGGLPASSQVDFSCLVNQHCFGSSNQNANIYVIIISTRFGLNASMKLLGIFMFLSIYT